MPDPDLVQHVAELMRLDPGLLDDARTNPGDSIVGSCVMISTHRGRAVVESAVAEALAQHDRDSAESQHDRDSDESDESH